MIEPLRVDAEENRRRIVAAARLLFAESGVDVPMGTVARHAGVGLATLYRRFPTREHLIAGAFADQMTDCEARFDEALAGDDPARGFRDVVSAFCASQVTDKGLTHACVRSMLGAGGHDGERAAAERTVLTLLRRAQKAGTLRADVTAGDLLLLLAGNAGVIAAAGPVNAAAASRRYVGHMLRSFATA